MSQRTARNATIAGLLLVSAVVLTATFWRGGWTERPPMEGYIRDGARAGAARLQRDLLAAHPAGSDLGALLGRLASLGFDCRPGGDPATATLCLFRAAHRQERQVVTVTVEIAHDGLRLRALGAEIAGL